MHTNGTLPAFFSFFLRQVMVAFVFLGSLYWSYISRAKTNEQAGFPFVGWCINTASKNHVQIRKIKRDIRSQTGMSAPWLAQLVLKRCDTFSTGTTPPLLYFRAQTAQSGVGICYMPGICYRLTFCLLPAPLAPIWPPQLPLHQRLLL